MMLTRRNFLSGVAALSAPLILPYEVSANSHCNLNIGISDERFSAVAASQKTNVWCWAATLEMIFKWYGVPISQHDIVCQVLGCNVVSPSGVDGLLNATSRSYVDQNGKTFYVRSNIYSADVGVQQITNKEVLDSLNASRPLIYCNRTHMMVLISGHFGGVYPKNIQVCQLRVADPYYSRVHLPKMQGKEFFRPVSGRDIIPIERHGNMRFLCTIGLYSDPDNKSSRYGARCDPDSTPRPGCVK